MIDGPSFDFGSWDPPKVDTSVPSDFSFDTTGPSKPFGGFDFGGAWQSLWDTGKQAARGLAYGIADTVKSGETKNFPFPGVDFATRLTRPDLNPDTANDPFGAVREGIGNEYQAGRDILGLHKNEETGADYTDVPMPGFGALGGTSTAVGPILNQLGVSRAVGGAFDAVRGIHPPTDVPAVGPEVSQIEGGLKNRIGAPGSLGVPEEGAGPMGAQKVANDALASQVPDIGAEASEPQWGFGTEPSAAASEAEKINEAKMANYRANNPVQEPMPPGEGAGIPDSDAIYGTHDTGNPAFTNFDQGVADTNSIYRNPGEQPWQEGPHQKPPAFDENGVRQRQSGGSGMTLPDDFRNSLSPEDRGDYPGAGGGDEKPPIGGGPNRIPSQEELQARYDRLSQQNKDALARGKSPDLTPEQKAEASAPMPDQQIPPSENALPRPSPFTPRPVPGMPSAQEVTSKLQAIDQGKSPFSGQPARPPVGPAADQLSIDEFSGATGEAPKTNLGADNVPKPDFTNPPPPGTQEYANQHGFGESPMSGPGGEPQSGFEWMPQNRGNIPDENIQDPLFRTAPAEGPFNATTSAGRDAAAQDAESGVTTLNAKGVANMFEPTAPEAGAKGDQLFKGNAAETDPLRVKSTVWRTMVVNNILNAGVAGLKAGNDVIQAALGTLNIATSRLTSPGGAAGFAEAPDRLKVLWGGFAKGMEQFSQGFKNQSYNIGEINKPSDFQRILSGEAGPKAQFAGKVTDIVTAKQVVPRLISGITAMAQRGWHDLSIYDFGLEQGAKQGLEGQAKQDFAETFLNQGKGTEGWTMERAQAEEQAWKDAAQRTWTNTSPLADALNVLRDPDRLARQAPNLPEGLRESISNTAWTVTPFVNLLTNLGARTNEFIPGANVVGLLRTGGKSAAEVSQVRLNAIIGATGTLALGLKAANGEVTGDGPTDQNARIALIQSGWKPNSVMIGDRWFENRAFGPLAGIINLVGNFHDRMAYDTKPNQRRDFTVMAESALDAYLRSQLDNLHFVGALGNIADTIKNGTPANMDALLTNEMDTAIPQSGNARLVERMIEPRTPSIRTNAPEGEQLKERITRQFPFIHPGLAPGVKRPYTGAEPLFPLMGQEGRRNPK